MEPKDRKARRMQSQRIVHGNANHLAEASRKPPKTNHRGLRVSSLQDTQTSRNTFNNWSLHQLYPHCGVTHRRTPKTLDQTRSCNDLQFELVSCKMKLCFVNIE